jgi:hypothetical protein
MNAPTLETSDRAPVGKVANLPFALREGICARMRDGWTGRRIIEWLEAQSITGVTDQNLSNWRHSDRGYRAWLSEQEKLDRIRMESDSIRRELEAGGGRIHDRLAVDFAQALVQMRSGADAQDPKAVADLAKAASSIIQAATARERVDLARGQLTLSRDKFELTACTMFLRWYDDQRARHIAESASTNGEKIKALRQTFFADVDALEAAGEVEIPK